MAMVLDIFNMRLPIGVVGGEQGVVLAIELYRY